MRLPDISFRTRLLIALAGSVALLGTASMAVVRLQTDRQVDAAVRQTADRARHALTGIERYRRTDLERIARRFTGSIRIPAALEGARERGHADEFAQDVQYELTLAELPEGLVAFANEEGAPVLTLVDGERVEDGPDPFAKLVLEGGDEPVSGYRFHDGRLFTVQGHRLDLFGEPVGTVTLGFEVDDEVARRLGEIAGVDVCMAAGDRCLAATIPAQTAARTRELLAARHATAPVFTSWEDRRLALVAVPLEGAGGVQTLLAVPIDDVVRPFERIQRAGAIAAGVTLLLALLVGIVLSRGLAAPIRTLVDATDRVRRGDYEFEVSVPHRDEIGRLAEAFNQMTAGLSLKERYRGLLDKVVSRDIAEELLRGEIRLGGEIREVSTFFSDLRGFTAITERMEPQAVIGMLNEWLELAAESIEQEGGVVDKYVGDQVMAIFGAPLAQEDHAVRAVRAAVRLRDVTAGLNREREARGEPPFEIGVGINTGPAVAGNTGSSRRLNYTVLGASVNVAARLCADAGPSQVLVSETTYEQVRGIVDAVALAPRVLKGFSRPLTPYAVRRLRPASADSIPGEPARLLAAVVLVAGLIGTPGAARAQIAQIFDLPTLEQAGVRYVSPGGLVQIQPSLRFDLEGFLPQDEPAWHLEAVDPFLNVRGRFFVDAFVGRRVFASTELRVDRGQPPRAGGLAAHLQQGFVRVTPAPGTRLHLQAGKFISPFGNYPQRAHTAADPFIRPPLAFDHRTVMQADFVPRANDGVFNWKNNPALRADGLPIVWAVPYPIGGMVTGGVGGLAFRAAVVNSAPSAEPADWNRLRFTGAAGPSLVGHASIQIVPELQLGASYSRGSYQRRALEDELGPVAAGRQDQEAVGLEATLRRGHLDVRGELLINRWEVFRVIEDPRDLSYYAEARLTLAPGLFAAVRYNAIHFRDIVRTATGTPDRWDYDRRRWQVGGGYRLGRRTELRAEYMVNRTSGRPDPRDNLLSVQWWWEF